MFTFPKHRAPAMPQPAQMLTEDARTAFLCRLTADDRAELQRLIHLGVVRVSYYHELGSHEPIAWIVSPCPLLSEGYERMTARYTPLELRELLTAASRERLDLSMPQSWQTLGEARRYGHF